MAGGDLANFFAGPTFTVRQLQQGADCIQGKSQLAGAENEG
jgi:hypothetical protein